MGTAKDGHGRKCHGFSYREKDQTCLLSPVGLMYDADYDYYEQNPTPVPVMEEKVDAATGEIKEVVVPGVKAMPPIDAGYKEPEVTKPWNETPQYKANLQMQEAAAKTGKKELAHKQRFKKGSKRAEESLENQIEIMKEDQTVVKTRFRKGNSKALKEQSEKRMDKQEQAEESTNKKYQLMLEQEKEAQNKKQELAQRAADDQA